MANSIKIGGFSFDALKIGSSDVDAAYIGDTLVYSGSTPPTPTYTYYVGITGLDDGDTCYIRWGDVKTLGQNGSNQYTTTAGTINVSIAYDDEKYTVDYDTFTLTDYHPSQLVQFTPIQTYTYYVKIQGLEGKDTCDIDWKNIKIDYSVGNGSYTITTTADTVGVSIANYDSTNYSVDYDSFTLKSDKPSITVTFTYQGGGNLQYIPQGTDMTQYYNRPITRFKIGDSALPSGYQQVQIGFNTGGQGIIDAWGGVNLNFGGTQVTSLPCDVSGFDEFLYWFVFDPNWAKTANNPFTDLWIEFA